MTDDWPEPPEWVNDGVKARTWYEICDRVFNGPILSENRYDITVPQEVYDEWVWP